MAAPPVAEQDPYAEVRVIDSQFQHFRNYIDVISVFRCRLCTFCSPLEHVIASHMSEVHFPKRSFLCKQCLFVFEDRSQLVSHLDSSHGSQSVSVCFGESGTFTNSPPIWRVAGRVNDGPRLTHQGRDSMDEGQTGEARNGRVSSSTGNMTGVTEDMQVNENSHRFGRTVSQGDISIEGDVGGNPLSHKTDHRLERVQSSGSSCHPSTTGQFYETIDTDSSVSRLPHENSVEQQGIHAESPDIQVTGISQGETRFRPLNKNLFIKTEPVSPVRGLLIPATETDKSQSLSKGGCVDENMVVDKGSKDENGTESPCGQTGSEPSPLSNSDSIERLEKVNSPENGEGKNIEQDLDSARSRRTMLHRKQSSTGYTETGGRGVLRRQATVELPDGENEDGFSAEDGSNKDQDTDKRDKHLKTQELDDSKPTTEVNKVHRVSCDKAIKAATDPPQSNLRDLLTQKGKDDKKQQQRDPRKIFLQRNMSEEKNIAESTATPAPRGQRLRSYSITEGEIQNQESKPSLKDYHQKSLPASMEHESPPGRQSSITVPHQQAPNYWTGYAGLAYQPHSWDGDPSKIWHGMAPLGHPAVHSDYRGPSRSQSEEIQPVPNEVRGSIDESKIYQRFFWKNGPMKSKPRRGHLTGSHSTEGDVPYSGYYLPSVEDMARQGMRRNQMRFQWQSASAIPSAGLGLLYQQEKSASPSISSSTQCGYDKLAHEPHHFHIHHSSGLELPSSERQNILGTEGNQELAHVEDITRQVQRAFNGAGGGLYNPVEHIAANGLERSSASNSQEERGQKETDAINDAKKRSRKSTFNIYREIPERKRKLNQDEEEKIKSSYNADGSFDYYSLTGWKAYKCQLCKKRRFKTQSELEEHKQRKHSREPPSNVRESIANPREVFGITQESSANLQDSFGSRRQVLTNPQESFGSGQELSSYSQESLGNGQEFSSHLRESYGNGRELSTQSQESFDIVRDSQNLSQESLSNNSETLSNCSATHTPRTSSCTSGTFPNDAAFASQNAAPIASQNAAANG